MSDYLFRPEVVRFALVLSAVVSVLFYERMQLTTGGAIVPAYLAVFLPAPVHIIVMLGSGYLTYLLVSILLARRMILYGRRKFEVEVLVGLALVVIGTAAARLLGQVDPVLLGLTGIGFVVPGVVAHDMFRQRPHRTLLALAGTTAIVGAGVYLFVAILSITTLVVPQADLPDPTSLAFPITLLLPAIITSVVLGVVVYARLGLRSGGFITGAYLAIAFSRPLDLLFIAAAGVVTYLLVVKVLMPRMLLFGRRKLSTMVLVGTIVAWGAELTIASISGGAYVPWRGFSIVPLLIPALMANDAQRQGLERTAWGAAIVALGVFGVINLVRAALLWA